MNDFRQTREAPIRIRSVGRRRGVSSVLPRLCFVPCICLPLFAWVHVSATSSEQIERESIQNAINGFQTTADRPALTREFASELKTSTNSKLAAETESISESSGDLIQNEEREPSNLFSLAWHWLGILTNPGRWRNIWQAGSKKRADSINSATAKESDSNKVDAAPPLIAPVKTFVVDQIDGVEIAYTTGSIRAALGVVLMFHGCGQTAVDWFQLPEHRRVVREFRKARLAVLAFTAVNKLSQCWSTRYPAKDNEDVARVSHAFRQWFHAQNLHTTTPLYGVGLSSGGGFVSILTTYEAMPRISSQVIYISPGSMRAFRGTRGPYPYPPTLFVYVPGDAYGSKERVLAARDALIEREHGRIRVGVLALAPPALESRTLQEHEPRFSSHAVDHMTQLLTRSAEPYMETIRHNAADDVIRQVLADYQSRRALEQIVKMLSGQHELSSVHANWVVSWLVSHRTVDRRTLLTSTNPSAKATSLEYGTSR
jgi:hypothetical protein